MEYIREIAGDLLKHGIKMKDALHLACAMKADCNYFIRAEGFNTPPLWGGKKEY
jgi:hypothetical protein